MHPLPRSRRGTWLLAGALWLATCAGWWWIIPDAPRAVIREIGELHGFSADGKKIFDRNDKDAALRYWDANSGKLLAAWTFQNRVLLSEPRLEVAIELLNDPAPRTLLTDLASGRSAELSWRPADGKPEVFATSDGRYFVVATRTGDTSKTIWWDRTLAKSEVEFPGISALNVAPDGRWFTTGADSTELILRAPASLTEQLRLQQKSKWYSVSFSSNGDFIILQDSMTEIIDSRTGRCCASLPSNRDPVVFSEIRQAVAPYVEKGNLELARWDLDSGKSLEKHWFQFAGGSIMREPAFDWPNHGRIVVQYLNQSPQPMSAFEDWINQLGFGTVFLRDHFDQFAVFDIGSGSELGRVHSRDTKEVRIAPGGQSLAVIGKTDKTMQVWDIPPRKSFQWLVAGSLLFAAPVTILARWRVRRLRGA